MKTKRRAWVVAGVVVVLVLALTCAIPFLQEWWLLLAYDEHLSIRPDGWGGDGWTLAVYYKKASWLPGAGTRIVNQKCGPCQTDMHSVCREPGMRWINVGNEGDTVDTVVRSEGSTRIVTTRASIELGTWSCNCPDPSHKDKP